MPKNFCYLMLVAAMFAGLQAGAQHQQYTGSFIADQTYLNRGIVSRLAITKDSFVLEYQFAPSHLLHDMNREEATSSNTKTVNTGAHNSRNFLDLPGVTHKTYKGVWRVNNTASFLKNGFDITMMPSYGYDSMRSETVHLTSKDGDMIELTCDNGSVFWGLAAPHYFTSPTIFIDNVVADAYLREE